MRMSKTDKDAPFWVQNSWHGMIDHDHRRGECIVSEDQRDRWPAWRNHHRRCNKRVEVTTYCTKYDPNTYYSWPARRRVQTCWKWEYKCNPDPDEFHWHIYCERDYYAKCIGHRKIEYRNEIPCTCDERPEVATCFPSWKAGQFYIWGGVPSAFVRTYYHKPERARERKLRDLAREYNAYGDIEDGDFVNHQARNSARWDYW